MAKLRWNWRAGRLGRLLQIHSPSVHELGKCWCQRELDNSVNWEATRSYTQGDAEATMRIYEAMADLDIPWGTTKEITNE